MKGKRFFAILLTLCLVLTTLTPAASAVAAGADSVVNAGLSKEEGKNQSQFENGLLVSGEDSVSPLQTLRDTLISVLGGKTNTENGNWSIEPGQKPDVDLMKGESPDCVEELKEFSKVYSDTDVVRAFVVMEDAPLAESYQSLKLASAAAEKKLLQKQNNVISAIERTVLSGQKLDVRYQFTYLTNSFSVNVEFGKLEKIANLSGVKSVFIAPVYEACETVSDPNTYASGAMTGVHSVWENLGYTGEGMKIAVIDTGLDLDHPSFTALSQVKVDSNPNYLSENDVAAVLEDLNAYAVRNTIAAKTLYRSTKVPYAFNYVDENLIADHSSDSKGDHGTHVSGIAAANKTSGTSVVGMAPDAQIIVMKVFGAAGGAYTDDIVAALEDAMLLECDVVNASLGSPAGFSESGYEEWDAIYARLGQQNIVATISAGNEGTSSYNNMWGTDLNRTDNPDNGTLGSPSTYVNSFSIASAGNCQVMSQYISTGDGTTAFYTDSYEATLNLYGYTGYENSISLLELAGQELEYVYIEGLNSVADLQDADGNSLVTGKVVVAGIGESISYLVDMVDIVSQTDAVALLIHYPREVANFYNSLASQEASDGNIYIPVGMLEPKYGQVLAESSVKTLVISPLDDLAPRAVEGGQMSSFSSWGVTPDLRLLPDITGIGGDVYSCYDGGGYGLMSGTSMSAPQVAGVTALVMQYLYEKYPEARDLNDGTIREMAIALLMSTASPVMVGDVEASPRQQGSGLVNAAEAVKSKVYLTVNGSRPKAELYDNVNGVWNFSFELHNISNEVETFTLDSSVLTEAMASYAGEFFMLGQDMDMSDYISVTFSTETVTVAPKSTTTVSVNVTVSEVGKYVLDYYFANGAYVEGYIYLNNTDDFGVDLSLPFLGFYGDWTEAPIFDTAYWYDNSFWGVEPADGLPEGDEYYHVMWTDLAGTDWVLGFNPYSGALTDDDGNIIYDPAHNVVSPNGDGAIDSLDEIYLSLLRNAKTLTFTYTSGDTELYTMTIDNVGKTMYKSSYGQVVPYLHSWYSYGTYDFTDANGEYLPNGTQVMLTISATVDYGTGGNHSIEIPITVDTQAPVLENVFQLSQNGQNLLYIELSENVAPASVILLNPAGTRIYAQAYDYELLDSGDGCYLLAMDITGLGTEFLVALGDYAANESYYNVKFTADPSGNLPEVDTAPLYAYRQSDDQIQSDHMCGWVSVGRPVEEYANIAVHTDDYMEYAAINAAAYVGGKIFAVDAVGDFLVIDPGLWNRKTISSLGLNVLDMSFDDTTDTMYLLAKQGYSSYYLYTIDLLTGELGDRVKVTGKVQAMTFDDAGTLYAVVASSNNLYTLDPATGVASKVLNADGSDFLMTNSAGAALKPNSYMQSMTYSNADGVIYWAYYGTMNWMMTSYLVTIDPEALTVSANPYAAQAYDQDYNLVDYYPTTELVSLLVLEETEYRLPEATALQSILLDAESMVLKAGNTALLNASANPWNYDLKKVTWTSSDDTVATVDANGIVTAVSAGSAVITAESEGVTASCVVTVIDPQGTVHAYNYYSGDSNYGTMIDIDLGKNSYTVTANSPIDFMSGDYNGHDGWFYGYTEGGQFWRYDEETGEYAKLGDPTAVSVVDMAYDYTTGILYAVTLNYNTGESTLCMVNTLNGTLIPVDLGDYSSSFYAMMTLACDAQGNLYTLDAGGNLYIWAVADGVLVGAGVLAYELGTLQYLQSMCYDWNNNALVWAYAEAGSLIMIDLDDGIIVSLGDPTGSGMFEFVGMHTVPETIPELPTVEAESVTAEDMAILVGATKNPNVTVLPVNATNKAITWTSSDESVVIVNADGSITGVKEGSAVISGTLGALSVQYNVSVLEGADNIYGHVLTDLQSYGGQYWVRMYAQDTVNYDVLSSFGYVLYSEEYVDGKLYAVGYDPNDWDADWQYFTLDAETFEILNQVDMGDVNIFVYDMTFDPTTGTMYAVAGGQDATDIYIKDMETGALTLLLRTEQFFLSIAAGRNGDLYLMEMSDSVYDDWTWSTEYFSTDLYKFNALNMNLELVGNTGVKSNKMASMAYDYDTDKLYWTPCFEGSGGYVSSLSLIDPETAQTTALGPVGSMGAQVSGLYIISEDKPATDYTTMHNVILSQQTVNMIVGDTANVSAITMPAGIDAAITWASSDESIATVDENGVITGVSQGSAVVTATAVLGDVTKTASCEVIVLAADAAFLTWNATDMGWASISRMDYTQVTNLTEGEEVGVLTFTTVGNDVYGYDANNQLFKLDLATFQRESIGDGLGLEVDTDNGYIFEIRGMTYNAAAQKMLVLGSMMQGYADEYGFYTYEIEGGCRIYELDLTTGNLTELCSIYETSYVRAITSDSLGNVYIYSCFNDVISVVDLESGSLSPVSSLQSQQFYGDSYCAQTMHYDELTKTFYVMQTGNGKYYRMVEVDAATTIVNPETAYVGGAYYDPDTWTWMNAKQFTGLATVELPEDPYQAKFFGGSATMDGTIGLNFYLTLSDALVNAEDAKMVFQHNGETLEVPVSEAVESISAGTTRYRFTIRLTSVEMADEIVAQMYVGDKAIGEARTYSVQQYAMNRLAKSTDETEIALMKALLNYGAYAQIHFGYNVEDLANAQLDAADQILADVSADDLAAYQRSITGSADGLQAKGASLIMESGTVIRVYFTLTGDKTIDQYTFTVDGKEVTPQVKGNQYYIEVPNVASNQLDQMHTFTADGITVTYSAYSYVLSKLDADESVSNMVKALYAYGQAATAYFG